MAFRVAKAGRVLIGGDNPLSLQSMLKNPLSAYSPQDFCYLFNLGCDIMRFSIRTETVDEIRMFVASSPFAVVADIQGNISQALMAIDANCAGIRINPGNFEYSDLERIIDRRDDLCIRIGINEASLGGADALKAVDKYISFFESHNFNNIVVSLKSSSPQRTIELNREYAESFDYPLHIGLTEAGITSVSAVRSTLLFQTLLQVGIGSTIRYSISSSEADEIRSGVELLSYLGFRPYNFRLISCPMCSRHGIDTQKFSQEIERYIFSHFDSRFLNMTLAVMGCVINGRGEARGADVAVCALSNDQVEVYHKSVLQGKYDKIQAMEVLKSIIDKNYIKKV